MLLSRLQNTGKRLGFWKRWSNRDFDFPKSKIFRWFAVGKNPGLRKVHVPVLNFTVKFPYF